MFNVLCTKEKVNSDSSHNRSVCRDGIETNHGPAAAEGSCDQHATAGPQREK